MSASEEIKLTVFLSLGAWIITEADERTAQEVVLLPAAKRFKSLLKYKGRNLPCYSLSQHPLALPLTTWWQGLGTLKDKGSQL